MNSLGIKENLCIDWNERIIRKVRMKSFLGFEAENGVILKIWIWFFDEIGALRRCNRYFFFRGLVCGKCGTCVTEEFAAFSDFDIDLLMKS